MRRFLLSWIALALSCAWGQAQAQGQKLRIITWADYVPADLIAAFKKETGIEVEVTLSNNEEMISKLRATGGAGYDLAQPSQDRITGVQREFGIYKPIDLSRSSSSSFGRQMLEIVQAQRHARRQALRACLICGAPTGWSSTPSAPRSAIITDLCRPDLKGKTSMRLRRPDPDGVCVRARARIRSRSTAIPRPTRALMEQVGATLIACKPNFKFFYDNKDQLLNGIRSGEVWRGDDVGYRRLDAQSRESGHSVTSCRAPARSAGSTPSRCRRAGATTPRRMPGSISPCAPRMPPRVIKSVGNFSAARGTAALVDPRLRAQFTPAFPDGAFKNIHWYPAIPPGLEEIEGRMLDRIKAAN